MRNQGNKVFENLNSVLNFLRTNSDMFKQAVTIFFISCTANMEFKISCENAVFAGK